MPVARWSVFVFLLLIPGAAAWTSALQGHDFARIAQTLLGIVCCLGLAWHARSGLVPPKTAGAVVAVMVGVPALAAVFASPSIAMAWLEASTFLGLAAVAAVVASMTGERGDDDLPEQRLLGLATLAITLYTLLILFSYGIALHAGAPITKPTIFPSFNNYRLFNHVQTATLPILVIAIARMNWRAPIVWMAWLCLIFGLAFLGFTEARATLVAFVCATLVAMALLRAGPKPLLSLLAVAFVLSVGVYFALFIWLPDHFGSTVDTFGAAGGGPGVAGMESDHSRFYLWKIALDDVASHPWLGVGPMHYAHQVNLKGAHPHNFYLQLIAEWGIPAALMLVAACARGLFKMAAAIQGCGSSRTQLVGVGLLSTMVAIAVDAAFSGNFVMPVSQVWIAVVIGWAVGWSRANAGPERRPKRRGRLNENILLGRLVAGALVISVLATSVVFLPQAFHLDRRLEQARALDTSPGRKPRFWSDGWF